MKKISLLISTLILFVCAYAWAEETAEPAVVEPKIVESVVEPVVEKSKPPKTLLTMKGTRLSGYGGVYSRFSQVGDTEGWFVGGRGGILINDNFSFGGGGMGLVSPKDREKLSGRDYTGLYDTIDFGYGGFLAEYYFNPKSLFVVSLGVLTGGGGLAFSTDDDDDDDDDHHGNDKFFVAEPELNVFVNITRFCRAGIGVSYRYIAGIDSDDFSNKDFRGPAVSAMVQFGWF